MSADFISGWLWGCYDDADSDRNAANLIGDLRESGSVIVELPKPEDPDDGWAFGMPESREVLLHNGEKETPDAARTYASWLLAAADAAEASA